MWHELSCPVACGILADRLDPCPLNCKAYSAHWTLGSPLLSSPSLRPQAQLSICSPSGCDLGEIPVVPDMAFRYGSNIPGTGWSQGAPSQLFLLWRRPLPATLPHPGGSSSLLAPALSSTVSPLPLQLRPYLPSSGLPPWGSGSCTSACI